MKENGKTTPMPISQSDRFTLKLIRLDDNKTVDVMKNLTVVDAINGKIRFFMAAGEVEALLTERGTKEDRYYLKPVYSLVIEATTQINGVFVARIGKVYVG
ncbi:MAG: hypothetical protein FNT15_09865 [Sulfurovum sp.]|nr:MAG: hypothetical protein FNT15_09865 [Sulfurovum sp.]